MLVENSLVAVVSLPSGCFNPYSGVKTSILILDKSIAKKSDTIACFKVENDGFGLGAQRRAFDKNDLPQVQAELAAYLSCLRTKASTETILALTSTAQIVPKEKIAAKGDYNLSGERYREGGYNASLNWPMISLGEVCKFSGGTQPPKDTFISEPREGYIRLLQIRDFKSDANAVYIPKTERYKTCELEDVMIGRYGPPVFQILKGKSGAYNVALIKCIPDLTRLDRTFLFSFLSSNRVQDIVIGLSARVRQSGVLPDDLSALQIPLPPLEVQKEIVAEIEGYQKVINGARAVLDNYRPHIPIHPDWPMVELGEAAQVTSGYSFDSKDFAEANLIKSIKIANVGVREFVADDKSNLPSGFCEKYPDFVARTGDLVIALTRSIISTGLKVAVVPPEYNCSLLNQRVASIRAKKNLSDNKFIYFSLCSGSAFHYIEEKARSLMQPNLSILDLKQLQIPLPPLATQQAIVAEIEAEQALVAANCELITRFEQKIQTTLARIWGEEVPAAD